MEKCQKPTLLRNISTVVFTAGIFPVREHGAFSHYNFVKQSNWQDELAMKSTSKTTSKTLMVRTVRICYSIAFEAWQSTRG